MQEEEDTQQLGRSIIPLSAVPAQGSAALSLNREETLSEQSLKTLPNNPEEHFPVRGSSGVELASLHRKSCPSSKREEVRRQFLPTLSHGVSLPV